jgi:histidinol-phosphatase (PHP family)
MSSGSYVHNTFDWATLTQAYETVRRIDSPVKVRLGVEFGEANRDLPYAKELLGQLLPVDFIIGSRHQLSDAYGGRDLAYASSHDPNEAKKQIRDYLEMTLDMAKWGKFSVLGHLTLPLRYMNERCGLHMTFDGFEAEVEDIFRALIANGCGIEVNTNRGNDPLPGAKWLKLYRACGGEIVTLGSDAHTANMVGCCIRERQALLRECGFTRFTTFQNLEPCFHAL